MCRTAPIERGLRARARSPTGRGMNKFHHGDNLEVLRDTTAIPHASVDPVHLETRAGHQEGPQGAPL